MAIRTDPATVQEILANDYDGETSLNPFIETASAIVDRVAACAIRRSKTLTPGELELVERWLAAHFYCMSDPQYAAKSTDAASATFTGQTGMRIESTRYGQTALTVDYSGCLDMLNKRQTVAVKWLGKPASQQIPYDQRN